VSKMGVQNMGVQNRVPKWGSEMGVQNMGVQNMGGQNEGPKWGSQICYSKTIRPPVYCLQQGHEASIAPERALCSVYWSTVINALCSLALSDRKSISNVSFVRRDGKKGDR
jgi:hypothetical protein